MTSIQQLAGRVHHRQLAAGAVSRVYAQHRLPLGGCKSRDDKLAVNNLYAD